MRVVVSRDYYLYSSCDNFSYGETEDYTLNVQTVTCQPPTNLSADAITSGSARLTWQNAGDAFSYRLRWREQGSTAWTVVNSLNTLSYALSGLTTGTGYQWQVQSVCADATSPYTGQSFETLCPAPSSLMADALTENSARLTWTSAGSGRTYDLAYKPQNTYNWLTTDGLTSTTYALVGLVAGTVYDWTVRSGCTSAGSQAYTNAVSFVTAGRCQPVYLNSCDYGGALDGFVFNDLRLSSNSGCSVGGYRAYSLTSAPVTAGRSYTFTGTFTNSTYYEGATIWVDLNRNNIFESNELSFQTNSYVTATLSGSLTIPPGTAPGPMAMRVMVGYYTTPYDPCGTYTNSGETEDYILTVFATNVVQVTRSPQPACSTTPLPVSFGVTIPFGSGNVFTAQLSDSNGSFDNTPTVVGSVTHSTSGSLTVTIPTSVPVGDAYRLRIVSSVPVTTDNPSVSMRVLAVCTCPVAVSLTATTITGSKAKLAWASEGNADAYSVQWRIVGTTLWTTASGLSSAGYQLTGLRADTDYEWQVITVCSNGQTSSASATATFRTQFCGTATLAGTQSISIGQGASLTVTLTGQSPWAIAVAQNGYNAQAYSGILTSPYTFVVSPAISSTYTLATVSNGCGTLPGSGSAVVTVPCSPPTSLTETNMNTSAVQVEWAYVSGKNYNVQWKESTATTWSESGTYCCSAYYIQNLQYGKAYQWRIKSFCPDGQSDWTTPRSFTIGCVTPTYPSETVSPTAAQFSWNWMGNNATYTVQWKFQDNTTWTSVPGLTNTNYTATDLTTGAYYEWRVRTDCPGNSSSAFTTSRPFIPTCGIPITQGWSSPTSTSVRVYWRGAAGASFSLRWRPQNTVAWTESTTAITSTYTDLTGLTNNTSYEWQVKAVCSSTESSIYSPSS